MAFVNSLDSGRIKVLPKRDYSNALPEDFGALFEVCGSGSEGEGSVVEGVVRAVDSRHVVMDVGMKNDGRVHVDEFKISGELPALQIGDRFSVFVETMEDSQGYIALSREKALKRLLWAKFTHIKNSNEIIIGVICGKIKGGLVVNIMGVLAFLPGSQVGLRPVRDFSSIAGIEQEFHIISLDSSNRNVVVSRKSVFEASRLNMQDQSLLQIEEGQIIEGCVKNLTKYGAFIDLGEYNIDGLLHLTDMSWKRVSHPSELLSVGQKIKVQVVKVNRAARRISLGMKQLAGNPWADITQHYKPGDKLVGHVTNTTDYGVFVELKPGIEGLVYISEVSWVKSPGGSHPNIAYKKGQEVEVMVLGVEQEKHRISLSIKQCCDNPWVKFAEKYKIGDVVEGAVNNVTDFGVFVTLDGKVDGLIHVSDMTWGNENDQSQALAAVNKKRSAMVKILNIDVSKGRVSLGMKQIERDPVEDFLKKIGVGDILSFKVVGVGNDHLSVALLGSIDVVLSVDYANITLNGMVEKYFVDSFLDLRVASVEAKSRYVELVLPTATKDK